MKSLKHLFKRPKPSNEALEIATGAELLTAAMSTDRDPLLVHVPRELLVMQGGLRFDDTHPFMGGLRDGRAALARFYETCQPPTIAAYYGLEGDTRKGADLPPWEVPWQGRRVRKPPSGEHGLDVADGVSFYGPVSAR
ncbi:MAG: hypothetical protein AAF618_12255, partial [Pseudomonadota bacterium]